MHVMSVSLVLRCGPPVAFAAAVGAQAIQLPYGTTYTVRSLGAAPGVPQPYGGVSFEHDDPDVLLIGGLANKPGGGVYAIRVVRDAVGRIVGFAGTASLRAAAPYIDGGLRHGPSNVLFYTRYPSQEIGQIKVGSTVTDKVVPVAAGKPGALTFVPPGFPGAGRLKVVGYVTGGFYDAQVVPDGNGTFDVVGLTQTATLTGSPEGLAHVPPGSPHFPDYTRMLCCEYNTGTVSVLTLDQNGDPIPASRTEFMTGVTGVIGAAVDAASGTFVFSTYFGGDRVLVVDGFGPCGTFHNYGTGIPNAAGFVPDLRGSGCASFGNPITFQAGNGPPNAVGAMNIGFTQLRVPMLGGFVLTEASIPITHRLDPSGSWSTTLNTPSNPALIGQHVYFQAAYFDAGAPFGVTASYGLDMHVR